MKTKHEGITHGIVHAGFSGLRSFVASKKVQYKLAGNRPQSLTAHSLKRWA